MNENNPSIRQGARTMTKHKNNIIPISLKTSLLLMLPIFIVAVVAFWTTAQYFKWPSTDEQRTTAIYLAILFSVMPIAAYLLNFLSKSKAKFGVKALGSDITLDFGKNVAVVRPLDLHNNLLVPGTYSSLTHSGSEEVIRAISRTANSAVVTLDIRDGKAWWLSRLFALSAGAVHLGSPKAIVFLSTEENVKKTFMAWVEPRAILETIMRAYPDYEEHYMTARAIFNQLSLFPVPDPQTD